MEANQSVLLLNTTFEPLTVVTARRALKLLFSKKAQSIEDGGAYIQTIRAKVRIPSVIQIVYYIKKPYIAPKFSKRSVFIRDNFNCQYCGRHTPKPTIDHIIPRSKGGKTCWNNVVTACHSCNNKKGDRSLKESGMRLIKEPQDPKFLVYSALISPARIKKWERYFHPEKHSDEIFRLDAAITDKLMLESEATL
jgi:5-methylcytosine-specific restriction endonuclease McrA